jgi:acetyl esterase/lipase
MVAGVSAQSRAEISERLPASPDAHGRGRVGRGVAQLVDSDPGTPEQSGVPALVNADLTGLPPMLVQAATGDPVLDDATTLVDRAVEHGVDARFELFAVDTHDFHIFWSFLPEAASAMRQAGRFAGETCLGPDSASEAAG